MSISFLHSDYFTDSQPIEAAAVEQVFSPANRNSQIESLPKGSIVIPRFRMLPLTLIGEAQEQAIKDHGCKPILTVKEYRAIADIFTWSEALGHLTAPSYTLENIHKADEGRFFVKGQVNSTKSKGPTACFADTKQGAIVLAEQLLTNPFLTEQTPVIRPMQDYMQLGVNPAGLPIFNEQRVFVYRGVPLGVSFYWGNEVKLNVPVPPLTSSFYQTLDAAINKVSGFAEYVVIDMAQYSDGHWGVVELNDACHSGFPLGSDIRGTYQNLVNCV